MLILALCAVALGQLVLGHAPQVTTSQGTMRGQVLKSRNGREFFSFTKIPYAKPPLGELRFMVPEKAENWSGILDATQPIPACYQPAQLGPDPPKDGKEDCLYLNVFSPNLTGRYPVIYSIHGGGFVAGSAGDFGHARYFMDEDVVFVGANYRLGPVGFLSMEDNVVPGNMGLKDQALALEWVYAEISKFGGDPNRITVIGESAGGASTDIICSVPRTNGLVKACVSQSGVVSSSPWVFGKPGAARQSALNLATALGCDITGDVVKCLQSKPIEQVGNTSLMAGSDGRAYSGPVLEHPDAPEALLTRWPTGTNHSYPWIIGVCQDEGLIVTLPYELNMKTEEEREKFINSFNQTVISTYHLENRTKDLERIRARFFKKGVDPVKAIRNYHTESMFLYPSYRSLSEHPGPTYFYKFNYTRGPRMYLFNMSALGVPHASELPYFFEPNEQVPPDWPNADDIALSKELVKMWANFAIGHDPSINGYIEWPHFQGKYFLDIEDSGISIKKLTDYHDTLEFWNSIVLDQQAARR